MFLTFLFTFILFLFSCILCFIISKYKAVQKWTQENKPFLRTLNFVVLLLTILTVFFGISTYTYDKLIESQNQKIIIDNMGQEIGNNLKVINNVELRNTDLRSGGTVENRLTYYFLEKARDFISDKETREYIIASIDDIEKYNQVMNRIWNNGFVFIPNEYEKPFLEYYNKNIDLLITIGNQLKVRLSFIQSQKTRGIY